MSLTGQVVTRSRAILVLMRHSEWYLSVACQVVTGSQVTAIQHQHPGWQATQVSAQMRRPEAPNAYA